MDTLAHLVVDANQVLEFKLGNGFVREFAPFFIRPLAPSLGTGSRLWLSSQRKPRRLMFSKEFFSIQMFYIWYDLYLAQLKRFRNSIEYIFLLILMHTFLH